MQILLLVQKSKRLKKFLQRVYQWRKNKNLLELECNSKIWVAALWVSLKWFIKLKIWVKLLKKSYLNTVRLLDSEQFAVCLGCCNCHFASRLKSELPVEFWIFPPNFLTVYFCSHLTIPLKICELLIKMRNQN